MECYRKCNESCDNLKTKHCLHFISKEEYDYRLTIEDRILCPACFSQTVEATYGNHHGKLCTTCKRFFFANHWREIRGEWDV